MSDISNEIRDIAISSTRNIDSVIFGLATAFATYQEDCHMSILEYSFAAKSDEDDIRYRTYLLLVAEALE